MTSFFFIVANLILLGLNAAAVYYGVPSLCFSTALLFVAAGITGRLTGNTYSFFFWFSIGSGVVYSILGVLALLL